jgi:hypothetical protein
LLCSSLKRSTRALFSSVDIGVAPFLATRRRCKKRRTTTPVVAGFTCCSPQPGWPGRGGRQGNGAVWLDPRPVWRCSLTRPLWRCSLLSDDRVQVGPGGTRYRPPGW